MERGTGKTTKLLAATPPGGIFVVQNHHVGGYIRHWLKANGRTDDNIKIISMNGFSNECRGLRRPITVDHTIFDTWSMYSEENRFALETYISCYAPFSIRTNEHGDVITWWNQRL